jgi:spore coat polysaccharide biosynthesis protein SpsF
MESTRLPGKVLKPVLGKPLLGYLLDRLCLVESVDRIVVATTVDPKDQQIVDFCKEQGVSCYRGSEQNVLSRYYEAAKVYHADLVVRITADCPLIDPAVIDHAIRLYRHSAPCCDYISNALIRSYPRGMDVEVFSMHSLAMAAAEAKEAAEREHVTLYLYRHPERFRCWNFFYSVDASHYRLTVDETSDFILMQKILENLYSRLPSFTLEDILSLLRENPDWATINANVQQKNLNEDYKQSRIPEAY